MFRTSVVVSCKRLYSRFSGGRAASRHSFQRRPSFEALEERTLMDSGTWTALTNVAPSSTGLGTMMLLTDGTVMAQGGGVSNAWYQLTPSLAGSYAAGTWTTLASMGTPRLYYASNVLPSGNVFVQGGEYTNAGQVFTNTGEIYNPLSNTWTPIATFPNSQFGDDPSQLLDNGSVLTGYISGPQTYFYNPTTDTWSAAATKLNNDQSDEEGWIKMPNGGILSYNVFSSVNTGVSTAQYYDPTSNTWIATGNVPVLLSSSAVGYELGPGTLLPNGNVFIAGANGNTAVYNPTTNSWTAGPVIPNGMGADDAPGAMLPTGQVLFGADHPLFGTPSALFLYDPSSNTISPVTSVPTALTNILNSQASYLDRTVMLPTGQVLFGDSTNALYVYTPSGTTSSAVPVVQSVTPNGNGTYTLTGTQLNGQSEGASYGDDVEMSSNYPIVSLTDSSGDVFYARTSNWSTTGVQTGSTPETVTFTLPANVLPGTYSLYDSGAGLSSSPFLFSLNGTGATHFQVTAPTGATAGTAFNVTVQALDQHNNLVTGYIGTVHFTSSDGQAGLPANYIYTQADAGSHTFSVTLKTAGNETVTTNDAGNPAIKGTASVAVAATSATHLSLAGPGSAAAGTAFNLTVMALDTYGNIATGYAGTVHFSSSDSQAGLPANYAFVPTDAGTHVFSVTLGTVGSQSITAADTVTGTIAGSATVRVTAGSATHFGVTGGTATAGKVVVFTVTALDSFGNVATGYLGTIRFTSSDPNATLPNAYTFTAADAGKHLAGITFVTAGTQTVTAIDTKTSSITGKGTFTVTASSTKHYSVSAPSTATAGKSVSITVKARDVFGNVDTTYVGTVHFTSTDTQAGLPADYTFLTSDLGMHVFSVTLRTAGSQTVTATDTVSSSVTGKAKVSVAAAKASTLSVSAPISVNAGIGFSVTVTARDPFGNLATSYRDKVHVTSSDSNAVLPPDHTFTRTDAGLFSFSVTLNTTGSQTLTFTDTTNSSIVGSVTVTVSTPGVPGANFLAGPAPENTARRASADLVYREQGDVSHVGAAASALLAWLHPLAAAGVDAYFSAAAKKFVTSSIDSDQLLAFDSALAGFEDHLI